MLLPTFIWNIIFLLGCKLQQAEHYQSKISMPIARFETNKLASLEATLIQLERKF